MSINIKEIFQSDNLSVSQDKINYNFDQILANGGGPQGLKGDKGTTGALGSIGPKGDKGEVGAAGPKGNTGADGYWDLETYVSPIDQHTLIPKIQPTSGSTVGDKPTNILLGVTDPADAENAINKSSLFTLIDENNGSDWTNLISFRLKSGSAYSATTGVIRMIPTSGGARLKIAANGGNNIFELQSNDIQLNDGNGITKLRITNSLNEAAGTWNFLASSTINIHATGFLNNDGTSNLYGNNNIGAPAKYNNIYGGTNIMGDFLKIKPAGTTPVLNKILVAQDTDGYVAWRNPTEVIGMYPQGSIMFVSPTEITDTYFWLTNYDMNPSLITDPNAYWFGRGRNGTRWAGWYLLMGQTNAWYYSNTTLFSYVPTNVPGSIIIGASGPDDKVGVTNDIFDSSMGLKKFNPLNGPSATNGYGANYQPQLRGTYTGGGSNTAMNIPRDLTNFLDNDGTYYDTLASGAMADPIITGNPKIYPDDPGLSFMPLPMAIYLGRVDLVYNYSAGGFVETFG
jgi:hypothetical protein